MNRRIAAALLLLSAFLPGCAGKTSATAGVKPLPEARLEESPASPRVAEGRELFKRVKTLEEAEEIAELYGIELVDFSYGVATYHTEEDPGEVIARGEAEGWPKIALNTVNQKKKLN